MNSDTINNNSLLTSFEFVGTNRLFIHCVKQLLSAEVTIIIPIEHISESLVPEGTNECHLKQLYPLHLLFYDCYVKTCGGRAGDQE